MHFCGRCWCHSRTRNRKCFTHFVGFSISWVMRKTAKSKKSKMKFQFESFEYSIRIQSLLQPVGYQSFKDILQEQPKKKHVNLITGIIIYIRLLNRLARFFLSWLDPMDTFDWLRLIFLFFLFLLLLYSFLFSLTAPYLQMQIRLHVGKLLPSKSIGYETPKQKSLKETNWGNKNKRRTYNLVTYK